MKTYTAPELYRTTKWRQGDKPGYPVEAGIGAARLRLEELNGAFPCAENAEALGHLDAALAALAARTKRREAAGIEGQHTEEDEA